MKARTLLATTVAAGAVAASTIATTGANAMPACKSNCYSAGTWFWNKQAAQLQLLNSGLEIQGRHYEVNHAVCYGQGRSQWGSKGPQFQHFHCSVHPFTYDGKTDYRSYGLTFFVRGHFAWTWGSDRTPPLSQAQYVKQMTVIGHQLSTSINSVATVTDAKSAATALGKVQTDLRNAADQMDAISPPTEINDQHQALTKAVNDFAVQLDPIIEKLNNGNLSALATLTTLKAFKELQTAASAITKAGYKING